MRALIGARVDDGAAARFDDGGCAIVHAVVHAPAIHVHDAVQGLAGLGEDGAVLAHPGIVDEHVQSTALVHDLLHQLLPGAFVGNVHRKRHGFSAVGNDGSLDPLQSLFFDVGHVHLGTLLGDHLGFHLALAARGAGHDDHLTFEFTRAFRYARPTFGLRFGVDLLLESLLIRTRDNGIIEKLCSL